MSTDKERLDALLTHLRKSANELAKSVGYTRTDKIYHIIKGRNGISPAVAKDITTIFDEISYNWLLTGEGEMLKQSPSDDLSAAKSEINADSAKNWDEVRKKAEEQLNMLGMGSPMNDREQKLAYLLSESTNEASYWKNKCKLAEMNLT